MKKLTLLILLIFTHLNAQNNTLYQQPSSEILELALAKRAPSFSMNSERSLAFLFYTDSYKTIQQLSETEMRLAGLRINPVTNIGSRTTYYTDVKIQNLDKDNEVTAIKGFPNNPQLSNFVWSPDQKKMAFLHTNSTHVELWLINTSDAQAKRISTLPLNANMGRPMHWFGDSKSLLVRTLPKEKQQLINANNAVPTGPTISENDGKKAQNRTYQDLLKNKNDEFNFEQLIHSDLYQIDLDGKETLWLSTDKYSGVSFSPDGEIVMVSTIQTPYSYLVPYYRFPSKTTLYTKEGKKIKTVLEVPLIEDLPKGFMAVRTGMRNLRWRSDKPATLYFAQALDKGDPEVEVEYRDQVMEWEAPFDQVPRELIKTKNRFNSILWGNDHIAIARDYWWNNRNTKSYIFDPEDNTILPKIIEDRNYNDVYNDPGDWEMERNTYGRYVLTLKKDEAFLIGDGYTENGQYPFLDKINLQTNLKKRLYHSTYTDKLEEISAYDVDKNRLVVRIESPNEYPARYFRDLKTNELEPITNFENPYKSIQNIHKEVIEYKRADGVELSGTLYLPEGYDFNKKEKLPMILWAYPREYKDKNNAGQNTQNPNEFTYPYYGSPIYWVTKGYAVLDDASFPIVGEGDKQPNDSFRTQLVANAKAAIDAVDKLGYVDTKRVAVGGHSYGAFMVANLLSHSNLFAAGIARSGAYNRTLTPFGFQSEERNYWEAPEVYNGMSPFMHADKMKTPLLLIHGEADNNSGTYPMQSERYFNALKGLGATVRLVVLPKESHGYSAKESVLHLLWEQDQWLEKYVKNKK